MSIAPTKLTRRDFENDQEIKWCPGCGLYSSLSQIQKVLPDLGVPREDFVFVAGGDCNGRTPRYLEVYGVETTPGVQIAFAEGLKLSRPELSVWIVLGDEELSRQLGHLDGLIRRNTDVVVLIFNDGIKALTKGQAAPTTLPGQSTKSTPDGVIGQRLLPLHAVLSMGVGFAARGVDVETRVLQDVLRRAHAHHGTAVVEILQNCNVFNDGAFADVTDRDVKAEHTLELRNGYALTFGKEGKRGLHWNGFGFDEIETEGRYDDLLIHDERMPLTYAQALSRLGGTTPTAVGVLRADSRRPCYEEQHAAQVRAARQRHGEEPDLQRLLMSGDIWSVGEK